MGKGKAPADPHKPAIVKNSGTRHDNDTTGESGEMDKAEEEIGFADDGDCDDADKKMDTSAANEGAEKGSTPSLPEKVHKGETESVA